MCTGPRQPTWGFGGKKFDPRITVKTTEVWPLDQQQLWKWMLKLNEAPLGGNGFEDLFVKSRLDCRSVPDFPSFSRKKNIHHYIIDSFLVSISREIGSTNIFLVVSSGGMKVPSFNWNTTSQAHLRLPYRGTVGSSQ